VPTVTRAPLEPPGTKAGTRFTSSPTKTSFMRRLRSTFRRLAPAVWSRASCSSCSMPRTRRNHF
jgi:hypothetical protein